MTTQQSKSTAWVSTGIVSELAEQSTSAKPLQNENKTKQKFQTNEVEIVHFGEKNAKDHHTRHEPVDLPKNAATSTIFLVDSKFVNTWNSPLQNNKY